MDGVIVDSDRLHIQAERTSCDFFGINAPLSIWDEFRGTNAKTFWTHLVNNYSPNKIDLKKLTDYNYKIYLKLAEEKLELIAGSLDFIKLVREKYNKLAVATSGAKVSQEMVFNKFGLHDYFDFVLTGDQVEHGKPHPEPYSRTVEMLSLEPHECIVIEDSDNGIISAKAAGCVAIGITTTFDKNKLIEAGADHVVNEFKELYDLMN